MDHGLLNDSVSITGEIIKWYERIITFDRSERIREEAVMAYFKVLSRNSPGRTNDNHKIVQLVQSVSGTIFEPGSPRIQTKTDTAQCIAHLT
jgi:hypothetical protein